MPKEIQKKVFELTLAVYRVTDFFPQGEALRRHIREKTNDVFGMCSEYFFSFGDEEGVVMPAPHCGYAGAGILAKIESLKGYMNIARSLRYVKPINLTILEREYDYIAKFFSQELGKRDDLHTRQNFAEQNSSGLAWEEFSKRQRENEHVSDTKSDVSDKNNVVVNPVRKKHGMPSAETRFSKKEEVGGENQPAFLSNVVNERQQKIVEYIQETSQAKISDFFNSFADISSKTIQRDLQDLVAKNILKKEGEKRWTIYSLVN